MTGTLLCGEGLELHAQCCCLTCESLLEPYVRLLESCDADMSVFSIHLAGALSQGKPGSCPAKLPSHGSSMPRPKQQKVPRSRVLKNACPTPTSSARVRRSGASVRPHLACALLLLLVEEPVEAALEPAINRLDHSLEREAAVDSLHQLTNRRLKLLHAPPHGRRKVGYVSLPPRRPAGSLDGQPLLGSGQHEVERREAAHAGHAEAKDLGRPGFGDADRHDCGSDDRRMIRDVAEAMQGK